MKKINSFLIFCLLPALITLTPAIGSAQTAQKDSAVSKALRANQDTSWAVNTLKAPSSPGASLIGIAPSAIQRPTDPSGFSASLLNATNNLTSIPNSYAVDFAPAWLFFGQHISYKDFISNNVGKNIWQTLDISFAYKNVKDTLTNQTNSTVGIGMKISLLRGHVNAKAQNSVDRAHQIVSALLAKQVNERAIYERNNPSYRQLNFLADTTHNSVLKATVIAKLQKIRDSLNNVVNKADPVAKASLDSIKKIGESLDFARYGWKLDLAGGMSYYFPNQNFSNGSLNNAGAWLTGGYEDESSKVSLLAIARYLYNPKEAYADPNNLLKQSNLSTFDTGIRLLFESNDSKFTFGGELVYRSILNNTIIQPSYHYSISTDYQVGKNQLISFVFGRDFDGTITKGGNLLAALNFIIGFGNDKSIKPN